MKASFGKLALTLTSLLLLAALFTASISHVTATPPSPPIEVTVSFPDGAPPLNKIAKLKCVVKTITQPAVDMSLKIELPDAFEKVDGSLSWQGDVPIHQEISVIDVMLKSVQIGNWKISVTSYLDQTKNGGYGGTGHYDIYVAVSEKSADWGVIPPWYYTQKPRLTFPTISCNRY